QELAARLDRARRDAAAPLGGILERADDPAATDPALAAGGDANALVQRAQAGDAASRAELVDRLLGLVASHARRFRTDGLDQTDLVQEGIVGLLRALERYDPGRG